MKIKLKEDSNIEMTPEIQEWLDRTSEILRKQVEREWLDKVFHGTCAHFVDENGKAQYLSPHEVYIGIDPGHPDGDECFINGVKQVKK